MKCIKIGFSEPYETPEGISSMWSPDFKGSIIGKLMEDNCTTIFNDISSNHGGTYYYKMRGNMYNSSVTINVIGE